MIEIAFELTAFYLLIGFIFAMFANFVSDEGPLMFTLIALFWGPILLFGALAMGLQALSRRRLIL